MVYDKNLAERIRQHLEGREGIAEREMFGGIAFMLWGRVFVGVIGEDLMVRVGPERHAEALALPHARPMDFTGRPMKGYVFVGPEGCQSQEDLFTWVSWGICFVEELLKE